MATKHKAQYFLLFSLICLSLTIHLVPDLKDKLNIGLLQKPQKVLSVIKSFRINNDLLLDIYKIQRSDKIVIEIYDHKNGELLQQFPINKSHESYFNINGLSTNLFIKDINGDLQPDVLVPAYDNNLVASLHIYTYDTASGHFKPYQP